MGYPSSRRFPRSLAEAFPRQHANPITFYPSPRLRILRAAVCIAAVALIGALIAQGV